MAAPPRVTLGLRFKAWWDGCDVIVHQRKGKAKAIETPARKVIGYRDPTRPWETPRVKLAQMLWGEGFSHPGGAEQALKPRGQFLFTDFMLADRGKADSPPIRAWLEAEPAPVEPWSLDDFTRFLADEKIEVRVAEDVTDPFRRLVVGAWSDLTASTAGVSMTPELKQCLVGELERWTRRIAAFDSGDLRVFRVYALKNASSRMLSDW